MKSGSVKTIAITMGIGLCLLFVGTRIPAPKKPRPPLTSRPAPAAAMSAAPVSVAPIDIAPAPVRPSPVDVSITSIYPSPACIGDQIDATAKIILRAVGAGLVPPGSTLEYRWRWEFLGEGRVAKVAPARDPASPEWTGWQSSGQCKVEASFPSWGEKAVRCTVQARVLEQGRPTGTEFESVAIRNLTVVNLQDSPYFYIADRDIGKLTLRWLPSPSPGVAGYKYHIEPYRNLLYDVGNVTEVTITGLTPGKQYTIHLHTYDSKGHMTR